MKMEKRRKMDIFTEHIWAMILVRLPLKNITTSILVCKQWKTLVESPYFYELFQTHHQNTNASWSLMLRNGSPKDVMAHYGCKIWGLPRSLDYYVFSFIATYFHKSSYHKYRINRTRRRIEQKVKVLAYSDAGLILICVDITWSRSYYVANPISRQCIKIPLCPEHLSSRIQNELFDHAGLVTRIENGVVLDYKAVLIQTGYKRKGKYPFTFIIYSSETGLWSSSALHFSIPLCYLNFEDPICLNRDLHWIGFNRYGQEVVVSIDLYDSDPQYRVIPFPDSEKKPKIKRSCITSQGSLMYMNIVSEDKDAPERKFSVWRLKTSEWQLVSEDKDYFPLLTYPSDGNKKAIASINLLSNPDISMFVLPRWLYRIPHRPSYSTVVVSDPSPATLTRV